MASALEKALSEIESAKEDAAAKYAQLVTYFANEDADDPDDDPPGVTEVNQICADAGHTSDDLQREVNHILYRRQLRADLDRLPAAQREYREKCAAVEKLEAERVRWLEDHARRLRLAAHERDLALAELTRRESLRGELEASADPEMHKRRDWLTARRDEFHKQHAEIMKDVRRAEKIAAEIPAPLSEAILQDSTHPPEQAMRLERRAKHRAVVARAESAAERRDQHQREADRISAKIEKLTKELAEVSATLLTP